MSTCADCEFYKAENGTGRCKYDAAQASPTQPFDTAVWPVVDGTDEVCGKFEVNGA